MATWYVSKSGNDSTGSGSSTAPYLTIGKAFAVAANGDTIVVRSGVYYEMISSAKGVTLQGDGYVIVDGEFLRSGCFGKSGGNQVTFQGLIFQRTLDPLIQVSAGVDVGTFYDCEFRDAPCAVNNASLATFYNCVFRNLNGTGYAALYSNDNRLYNCTFDNITAEYGAVRNRSGRPSVYRSVFSRCKIFLFMPAGVNYPLADYNAYDFSYSGLTSGMVVSGEAKTTFAAYRSFLDANGGATQETNSQDLALSGQLVDPTKGCVAPLSGSTVATMGPESDPVGALRVAYGWSENRNNSQWRGGTHSGTEFTADGHLTLQSGQSVGTYTLPSQDLGEVRRLHGIRVADKNLLYPTEVVDADTNDTNPNRAHLEYKYSETVNPATDAAGWDALSWNKVERMTGDQAAISGFVRARWVQVRLTLRTNGVAA